MKNLTLFFFSILLGTLYSNAQDLNLNPNSIEIGDTITIKEPQSDIYLFLHPKEETKKKIKKGSKLFGAVGRGLGAVGVGTKSVEVLSAGNKINNTVRIVDTAIEVGELFPKDISELNVVLDDVYVSDVKGVETLLGEFNIKRKTYIVQLTNAFHSNEISLK